MSKRVSSRECVDMYSNSCFGVIVADPIGDIYSDDYGGLTRRMLRKGTMEEYLDNFILEQPRTST